MNRSKRLSYLLLTSLQKTSWLAGQVINGGFGEDNSGTYKIVGYEPHDAGSRIIHIKDCTDLCPSYAALVRARAPCSMLDESVLSPEYGFAKFCLRNMVMPICVIQGKSQGPPATNNLYLSLYHGRK